jgi:hypothetical protein
LPFLALAAARLFGFAAAFFRAGTAFDFDFEVRLPTLAALRAERLTLFDAFRLVTAAGFDFFLGLTLDWVLRAGAFLARTAGSSLRSSRGVPVTSMVAGSADAFD